MRSLFTSSCNEAHNAQLAIVHKILNAAYHLLSTNQPVGARLAKQLVRRLTHISCDVQVNPTATCGRNGATWYRDFYSSCFPPSSLCSFYAGPAGTGVYLSSK